MSLGIMVRVVHQVQIKLAQPARLHIAHGTNCKYMQVPCQFAPHPVTIGVVRAACEPVKVYSLYTQYHSCWVVEGTVTLPL
jgi:hypothetical protein